MKREFESKPVTVGTAAWHSAAKNSFPAEDRPGATAGMAAMS